MYTHRSLKVKPFPATNMDTPTNNWVLRITWSAKQVLYYFSLIQQVKVWIPVASIVISYTQSYVFL